MFLLVNFFYFHRTDFWRVDKKAEAFRKKIGERVREVRKAQKYTQAQLAFESGISRRIIVHIEKGVQNVTIDTLHILADTLNVKPETFFEFDNGGKKTAS